MSPYEIYPKIHTFSNGMRLVYLERKAFVAHLGVMILGGSRYERPDEEGLAHFLEHCIFKGTHKRKALDIFSDLDSVGGELNAYTNKEEICIHTSFRKSHFGIASELLGDIVQNASFPEDEISKEREVVLDEIISYLDSPAERIFDDFENYVFKDHSLGYNTLGSKKSVSGFHREHLKGYMSRFFKASNMVLSFVGDLPFEEVIQQLEEDFGSMNGGEVHDIVVQPDPFEQFKIREKQANYQTHTVIGGQAPSYHDDNRRAMTLLTNVLGGPALNSRLTLLIREQYGYAYNIEAGFTSYSDTGLWSIYMGTDRKYLDRALDLIYKELTAIREKGLTEDELDHAKEQLKGHIALSLDSNLELMFSLAKSVLIHGKVDSVSEIYRQIDSITTGEIRQVAATHFDPVQFGELIYDYE
ncbi:MAG: peptidase M16 [Fluviicola sp. XM-24bin1]|nr:MAG: peptidase M16 [Fluviicola sp. XM-24bin1]